ncbi:MAG: gamma-glutamyltransferase [Ignavibacteriales bacterium]|nr:gamma-glutamyltransferase [Ignavibacteriales bacterium]
MSKLKLISSKLFSFFLFLTLSLTISGCATFSGRETAYAQGMVVSADSLATEVGIKILRAGGNAIDAAVGVGFALSVTYPVAGNLGGGGFMVIRKANGEELTLDYREKAPNLAKRDMYLNSKGEFIDSLAQEGILASGVPGSVSGMLFALENHGTMTREAVISPSVELAENGFYLSEATSNSFNRYRNSFLKFPSTSKYFTKDTTLFVKGDIFFQKDLAKTLRRIIESGTDGFYKGQTAELIVAQTQKMDGIITLDDLAKYNTVVREVVKGTYRGYKILSMPPPSSGGVALIELLNILENIDLKSLGHNSTKYVHYLTEAMRRVYADRSKYLGDPDYYPVPVKSLISKQYAKKLFEQITSSASNSANISPGLGNNSESMETTHYSIIDKWGNAVSVTTTINSGYGSKVVVDGAGFFLNNEMDDFSAKPGIPNQFGLLGSEANSIEPGKRMLSSMTPTIVLKNDKPVLIVGSPGGSTIITAVLQVVLNVLDFNMEIKEAVNAPRMHHQWYPDHISLEEGVLNAVGTLELMNMGHKLKDIPYLGLIEAIKIDPETGKVTGATDGRGFGLAKGELDK